VVIRIGAGALLTAATAGSGQISGPLAAFGLGIAAPLVIEKLARGVHVADPAAQISGPAALGERNDGEHGSAARDHKPPTAAALPEEGAADAR